MSPRSRWPSPRKWSCTGADHEDRGDGRKLASIGNITIPIEILTKRTPLTPREQHMLDSAYMVSASLLKDVPFDGPVVEDHPPNG